MSNAKPYVYWGFYLLGDFSVFDKECDKLESGMGNK